MSIVRDDAQAAAVATERNAVVRAGAGAGKTSVLVRRYIRLVQESHLPVEQILTLTFTRKAAAELHERIHRELATAALNDSFVAQQLEQFDKAAISTLDSFCATVARSGSAAFGIAPTFRVDEVAVRRFGEDVSLRFLMSGVHQETIHALLRLNRFEPLWRDGLARLAGDHFLISRPLDPVDMARRQRLFLLSELDRSAGEIRLAAARVGKLDPDSAKCVRDGQALLAGLELANLGGLDAVDPGTPLPDDVVRSMAEQSEIVLAAQLMSKRCGSSQDPEVAEYRELANNIKTIGAETFDILRSLEVWHNSDAAAKLTDEFQTVVFEAKRRNGVLSYHDVSALAISVLESDRVLRSHYKRRFRAIMIDEFQDNNEDQKNLLYLLAERLSLHTPGIPTAAALEPGKLFFVGDEKQSIYRFRGADVSVFKKLADEFGAGSLITLENNYRSEPGLIRFFNEFFGRIFGPGREEYEAEFGPLRSRPRVPGLIPSVSLWNLLEPTPDSISNGEAEAFHIARFIYENVERSSISISADPSGSGVRAAGYSDIAILMRTTGGQMQIERMLRLFGVPYTAQSARSLYLEAPLNDIYNALQLVLYPMDRVALAAFLRSPLVGMSDDGLVRILSSAVGATPFHTLVAPNLDPRDTERFQLALERHSELCALADTYRLTDLVFHIWYRWGYRHHLTRRSENLAYLDHYDEIYELAGSCEDRGLAEFLSTIRANLGTAGRLDELEVVRRTSPGVQIMTIHKAKGLEFPVVIVANTGSVGRSDRITDAPFYRSRHHGLVFNLAGSARGTVLDKPVNYIYRAERERARLEQTAELRRLIYVAATRAKSHLVFSGHLRGQDQSILAMIKSPFETTATGFAEAGDVRVSIKDLEPVLATDLATAGHISGKLEHGPPEPTGSEGSPATRADRYRRRQYTATELNQLVRQADESSDYSGPGNGIGPELLIDQENLRSVAEIFGSFAHYCVETLGSGRASVESLLTPSKVPSYLRPDLADDKLRRFLDEGVQLAVAFLSSELWSRASDNAEMEFELPFLLKLDSVRVRGKIDLVVVMSEATWVVDFKTDRDLDPAHYAGQLELYRRAALAIFGRPVQSFIHDLRTGQTHPVDTRVGDEVFDSVIDARF